MNSYKMDCDFKNKKRQQQMKKAGVIFSSGKSHKTIDNRMFKEVLELKLMRNSLQKEKEELQEEILVYESLLTSNCATQATQFHQSPYTMDIPYQPSQAIGMQSQNAQFPYETIECYGSDYIVPDSGEFLNFL